MQANKQQICSIFKLTARDFDRHVQNGMPAKKKSGARTDVWSVDTYEAHCWLVAQAVGDGGDAASPDASAERARLLRSQANISELTEAKLRGELLPADEV